MLGCKTTPFTIEGHNFWVCAFVKMSELYSKDL